MLAQEDYELQQLIASMEQEQSQESLQRHYGSDDGDYDHIFMECATQVNSQDQQQSEAPMHDYKDVEDMDMTDG